MKKIYFVFLLLCLISICSNAQKISFKVNRIAKQIAKINTYEFLVNEEENTDSKQTKLFKKLKKQAKNEDLNLLTNHPNAVVRVYAIDALIERDSSCYFKLIVDKIYNKDTVSIKCFQHGFGWIHSMKYTSNVIDNIILNNHFSKLLSNYQLKYIDSLLLFSNFRLSYISRKILKKVEPSVKFHDRIKDICKQNLYPNAVVALAKYKDTNDIDLIYNNLVINNNGFEAINIFPQNKFKLLFNKVDTLKFIPDNYWKSLLQFKDTFALNKTIRIIDKCYKENRTYTFRENAEEINKALRLNKTRFYLPIYFEVWEKFKYLNDSDIVFLYESDKIKTLRLIENSLKNSDEMNFYISNVLDFYVKVDSINSRKTIKYVIDSTNTLHRFSLFAEKAILFPDKEMIESLLNKLKISNNAHIYTKIVDVLLILNDENVNFMISEIVNRNLQINDWGLEHCKKVLSNKNIIINR